MPFAIKTRFEVTGLKEIVERLQQLDRKVKKRIVRKAVTKAARPVLRAAKEKCPTRKTPPLVLSRKGMREWTKLEDVQVLKKSLITKIKAYARGAVAAIIGPRSGTKVQVGTVRRKRLGATVGMPIFEDPARIAHLVEFGHGGPHPAPPRPFMRPAWDETKETAAWILRDEILSGIEREA